MKRRPGILEALEYVRFADHCGHPEPVELAPDRGVNIGDAEHDAALTQFVGNTPHFNFTGPSTTFVDDPGIYSRWRMQFGVRYMFN